MIQKLTYADYACIPDDGARHEIIEGVHYMNPAPNPYHQTVSRRLQYQLYRDIELTGLGVVFDAPVDVQLSEHDIVQPDLVVILDRNQGIVGASRIEGTPDLVIEILSPATKWHDCEIKLKLYARAGVREYWIADPRTRVVEQYVLQEGTYHRIDFDVDPELAILPGIKVRMADVW